MAIHHTQGLPAVLTVLDTVLFNHRERISKDTRCRLEAHEVLSKIACGLSQIHSTRVFTYIRGEKAKKWVSNNKAGDQSSVNQLGILLFFLFFIFRVVTAMNWRYHYKSKF